MLDSTRPVGETSNTPSGLPKTSTAGVPLSCPDQSSADEPASWFVLRATYSRELKVQSMLNEKGLRTFVPMIWRKTEKDGRTVRRLVPAVSNLCFVRWTKTGIDSFIRSFGESSPVTYYWDRTTSRPLTVPDKAMEDFIAIASTMDEDLIYITQISSKLREGQVVKVKDGPFKGVQGRIVRIRKSRRILVELPGMLAVASTYVRPEFLEIIKP